MALMLMSPLFALMLLLLVFSLLLSPTMALRPTDTYSNPGTITTTATTTTATAANTASSTNSAALAAVSEGANGGGAHDGAAADDDNLLPAAAAAAAGDNVSGGADAEVANAEVDINNGCGVTVAGIAAAYTAAAQTAPRDCGSLLSDLSPAARDRHRGMRLLSWSRNLKQQGITLKTSVKTARVDYSREVKTSG
ncbi:hypothetical protein VOLCADRAFT_99784 [Volvox carteri f. nagariensis]|uniref:Pherophorin domain-containing protein n=1 Tax=Volvox carteri f. nagariensis TaxID=3068 RepID=D8UIM8_VOLCA|nr:uncharacterized protein VOLCADRAFT_99784 [Volvox carteri f. nagariensis]EFJ40422.1 hypothetical protein VOLCADRAFT_99784 [Volvox carteri f. nagariensis]|eukprot:XP_002958502.1 hypothetical protein VOLCADRAFT_99784 [Volvox carteri f. nagariensis]